MISPEALRRYPHFAGVSQDCLMKIAKISKEREVKAGDRLFREGDTATYFRLVKTGAVNIVYLLGDNREVIADTLVQGEALSWSALLEPYRLTAGGVAGMDGAIIEIEAEGLRRICKEDLICGFKVLEEVSKTLRSRLSALRVQIAAQK